MPIVLSLLGVSAHPLVFGLLSPIGGQSLLDIDEQRAKNGKDMQPSG
jgi:hypothetical protein